MGRDSSLTDKQARFCKEYVIDFNASRAAKAAGYSLKTAEKIGSENLKKVDVQKEIKRLQVKTNKKLEVTAERVVEELARIGFSDEFNLKGFDKLDMANKLKAIEMLARHTGTFNNDESGKAVIKVKIGGTK